MMGTTPKIITLADWLTAVGAVAVTRTEKGYSATSLQQDGNSSGKTPEDALQVLCEATMGEGMLLDLDRSAKWRAAFGPDETQGIELADGEAGVIVREGPVLRLIEKLPFPDSGYARVGVPFKGPDGDIAIIEFSDQPWRYADPADTTERLANGESGIVFCNNGALELLQKIPPQAVVSWEIKPLVIGNAEPDSPADHEVRPEQGGE